MPSDDGDHPMSPFPFHDQIVRAAVEIEKDSILVAIEGRNRLYIIDVPSRLAKKVIINPTTVKTPLSLIPCPGYDQDSYPWLFLKDSRYISVVNTKEKRILPLLKTTNTIDIRRCHFLYA